MKFLAVDQIAVLAVQMAIERLEAENVPREIGKGVGIVAEGWFLETIPRMFPDPLKRSTGDHVPTPDVADSPGSWPSRRVPDS